ncbi:restriction endonuclease subunit S [Synechococcus sp. ROS8604]|uniref:restriction endonuclease subunit S n=1 Tax=Synechococcus sp. ROS8604 TaxID=1442557 RepID=UPI00185FD8E2|nr:restriction endonuclease subunit S [Synechococcus sp. ROS8604]QNI87739.1 Putative Type I restriction modification system S subunit [Synechococcus sp. ROS8604]
MTPFDRRLNTTLGEICDIASGAGFPKHLQGKTEGELAFAKVSDISEAVKSGQPLTTTKNYITTEVSKELRAKVFPPGSTLFAKIGEAIRLNRRVITAINCCADNNVMAVVPNKEISDKFIFYFLRTISFVDASRATTVPSIRKSDVECIEINLPPLQEQHRIADKLETTLAAVEACRQKLNNAAETIQRFRQSVLAAAVSGELTREWREERGIEGEWPKVSLSDHVTKPAYGTSSKSSPSGLVPVLRMGNIQNMKLDWGDLVYTSAAEEIEKYQLKKGDVLFNRTNSPELVGKTAIYNAERQAIYAGYLIRVRCNNTLLPEYLNFSLNSPQGRHYCWRVKSDGVSQSNINSKKLGSYKFGLPSIEEQEELCQQINLLLSNGEEIELKIQYSLRVLNNFTKALLAKAFRGELVPQDHNDEPASVLLERIKAQREAEAANKKPAKRGRKKKADAAQLAIPDGIADNHLAKVLEECGPLSELALLAASGLEPRIFKLQLAKELSVNGLMQVDLHGEAAYADAAWEEEL